VGYVTALAGLCLQDVERGAHGYLGAPNLVPQTGLKKSSASTHLSPASQVIGPVGAGGPHPFPLPSLGRRLRSSCGMFRRWTGRYSL